MVKYGFYSNRGNRQHKMLPVLPKPIPGYCTNNQQQPGTPEPADYCKAVAGFRCRGQQIDRGDIGRVSRPGFVEHIGKKFLMLLGGKRERERNTEFHNNRFLSAINGGLNECGKRRRTSA